MEDKIIQSEVQENEDNKKWVPWFIFGWAVSIITIILGWILFVQAGYNTRLEGHEIKDVEIKTQLSQIQTDLNWIRKTLDKSL